MARRIRQVWDAIGVQMKSFFTPQPGVCVQCHRPLGQEIYCADLPKEGIELEFCSQYCAHNYWGEFKRHCEKTAGRFVCSFPGCNVPCYREGSKVHDYCGRSHAKEHKAMMDAMEKDRKKHHYVGGASKHATSAGNSSFFKQSGPIKFYNQGEPYYEFTNFYEVVVVIDERHWPTTEHYFQAQKFVGTPILETIRMLSRPRQAFDTSRNPRYSHWRRPDWEQVKEDVMYKALQAKFSQHNDLRKLLLDTGERTLIEHSPHDSYWGDGGDGSGKNKLGELLMKLRDEVRSKKKEPDHSSSPRATARHLGKGTSFPESTRSDSKPVQLPSYSKPSCSSEHSYMWSQQSHTHHQHQHSQLPQKPPVERTDPQFPHVVNPPPTLHATLGGMSAQGSFQPGMQQATVHQSQYNPRESIGHRKPRDTTV